MGRDGDFSGKQHPVHFESSTFCLENEDYGMGLAGHVCGGCSPENSELGQRGEFQSDWCQISRPHRKAVLLFPLSPEPARPPPPPRRTRPQGWVGTGKAAPHFSLLFWSFFCPSSLGALRGEGNGAENRTFFRLPYTALPRSSFLNLNTLLSALSSRWTRV